MGATIHNERTTTITSFDSKLKQTLELQDPSKVKKGQSSRIDTTKQPTKEGLNRFHSAPTSPLVQMWIKTHRCLVCMKDSYLSDILYFLED